MTEVTASALSLAGFALAEAVSRVCDRGAGVALIPFTITDHAGTRALTEYASGSATEITLRAKLDHEGVCAAGEE